MDDKDMWEAVRNCDPRYDGHFFYAVKTTGIFCRPSCKSRTPIRKNVKYFSLSSTAISEGYRPCKRCRPDQLPTSQEGDAVSMAQTIMDRNYSSALSLELLSNQVGMSKFHLHRSFKKITGLTPVQYLTRLRVLNSVRLLTQTDLTITQIAYEVGYQSASHFNVVFKNYVGCSPSDYRSQRKGEQG